MTRLSMTPEDLDAFAERLDGPLGIAFKSAHGLIRDRMHRTGRDPSDFSKGEFLTLFLEAFADAAPSAYAHLDRESVDRAVQRMAANVRMKSAANADGGEALN
ncbi:hypothetical protein [Brevundimonas diminuta]|uniref:hypothetical protein n=1 Tax=Brevundimonas diminuta TaxID=293 RepID=UPI0030F4E63E